MPLNVSWHRARMHAISTFAGRKYGDIPTQEACEAAGQLFPWITLYDAGRSFQEIEVCSVFPELQVMVPALHYMT